MRFFGNAKRRKELSAAAKALREQGIQVSGPYRMRNGMLVFSLGHFVVTEAELLNDVQLQFLDFRSFGRYHLLEQQLLYRVLDQIRIPIIGEAGSKLMQDPDALLDLSQQQTTAITSNRSTIELRADLALL